MSSPTIGVTFHGLLGHLTFLSAINSFGESESVHQQPHAPDELKTAICHEIAAVLNAQISAYATLICAVAS